MFRRVCCLVLLAVMVLTCSAEREIPVVKTGSRYVKLGIDVSGLVCRGPKAAQFRQILENDLKLSGWFTVVPAGSATIRVAGTCTDSGAQMAVSCQVSNQSSGARYMNRTDRGKSSEVRRLAHEMADEIVLKVKRVPGIASTRIAMVGMRGGKKDIYICDYDGANLMRWTKDGVICISPNWSPAGDKLVYTSYLKGFPHVYSINMKSGVRSRISSFPGLNAGADVSPDGKDIVLTLSRDGGSPELYIVNIKTGKPTRLTMTRNAAEASPSWSPDGRKIVFVKDSAGSPQLYIMDRRTRKARRLSYEGSENVAPDWGPDGKIAYSSKRGGRYELCIVDPSTGRGSQLTNDGADYEDPSWAPDGRHIVCSRTVGYKPNLYILDTLGDAPIRLTKQQGEWHSPAWSPK